MPSPCISVVVCTYNRADILAIALRTLGRQALDPAQYEVIVVDNNSSDHTPRLVAEFQQQQANLRYVRETRQGLAHARNRGWHEARGSYVAYTDDDCKLPPQWLRVAYSIIAERQPLIFGGPYFPFYLAGRPHWFKDRYGAKNLGAQARYLQNNEYLSGGNIFFSRSLLAGSGGFNPSLGMAGDAIAYGEETDLIRRLRSANAGLQLYYEPQLFVYHLVRPEKFSLAWRMRASFQAGLYAAIVFRQTQPAPDYGRLTISSLRLAIGMAKNIGISLFWRDRQQYPFIQNYVYEYITPRYVRGLGMQYAQLQDPNRALHSDKVLN
jgi:glycosyltransferase involved in cell wall biosynthesis